MKKYALMVLMVLLIGFSSCSAQDQKEKQEKLNPGVELGLGLSKADQSGSESDVDISNFSFQPSSLKVSAGTKVTWTNRDSVQHTVTSDQQGLFDSGPLAPGQKFSFGFDAPGSYKYHCSLHPSMQGMIVVTGPPAQGAPESLEANLNLPGPNRGITPGSIIGQGGPGPQINLTGVIGAVISGPDGASGANDQATWTEHPPSGQPPAQGAGPQAAALQLNPSQGLGLAVGQKEGQKEVQQVQKFSQYYRKVSKAPEKPLTAPTKFELQGQEPVTLYFGSAQKAVPYQQYQSYALTTGLNSLWIMGQSSWTEYAVVPQGSGLTLIADSPSGGYGYLYEVYPDGTLDTNSYSFYPYNQIGFYADQVGQHLLFFVINGQPSNVIVIDVVAYQPPPPVFSYAMVTVNSAWLRGYSVYLDGSYQATEGTTGEPDGQVTITVPGDQYHTVAVYGSGFSYTNNRYFNAGWSYTLNV